MTPMVLTGFWAVMYQILIVSAWVGCCILPIWYGTTRPWYSSMMGQYLMAFSSTVAVVMTLASIRPLFGSGPVMISLIGVLLVSALGACGWWGAWMFYRVGRKDK